MAVKKRKPKSPAKPKPKKKPITRGTKLTSDIDRLTNPRPKPIKKK